MLTRLTLRGFRGFAHEMSFDCDGDAVILVGANGTGKTTFFDGLQWALFGEITRLKGSRDAVGDDYVRNRFVPQGATEALVHFRLDEGSVLVRRTKRSLTFVDAAGVEYAGAAAARQVGRLLSLGSIVETRQAEAFDRLFLLGQDEITGFVRDTNPRDRFDSLSHLLGLSAISRFYQKTTAWRDSTAVQLSAAETRLLQAERALDEVRTARVQRTRRSRESARLGLSRLRAETSALAKAAAALGATTDAFGGSAAELTSVIRDVTSQLSGIEETAQASLNEVEELLRTEPDIEPLRLRLPQLDRAARAAQSRREKLLRDVHAAQETLATAEIAYRSVLEDFDKHAKRLDEFAAYLQDSVRWVSGEECPVCQQAIDADHIRAEIRKRIGRRPAASRQLIQRRSRAERQVSTAGELVTAAMAAYSVQEGLHGRRVDDYAVAARRVDVWDATMSALLDRWGRNGSLRTLPGKLRRTLREVRQLNSDGGRLLAIAEAHLEREEVRTLRTQERSRADLVKSLTAERRSLRSAVSTIEKIDRDSKAAEVAIVRKTLGRQMPNLRAVYYRLRPHPVFDELKIDFKQFKDRGEVYYRAVRDEVSGNVSMMFSAAQLNAVAICVFMSLNLTRPISGVNWVLMDDPIQNMDDYNVLGLVDLLRSVRLDRQVVVSTHDEQLADLMRRKLRPQNERQRTVVHRLMPGDTEGPHLLSTADDYEEIARVLSEPAVRSS